MLVNALIDMMGLIDGRNLIGVLADTMRR